MKRLLHMSSEQAERLHCTTDDGVYTPPATSAMKRMGLKVLGAIALIAIFVLLMGTLLIRAAAAQYYQSGTQLNPNLGICIQNCSDASFAEAAADGFTWVRIDTNWAKIETAKGTYNWSAPINQSATFDQICGWCLKYHLKPHWLLDYGNTLYGGNQCTSDGITGFAAFAAACAKESVVQGIPGAHYEVWNEPENIDWNGKPYNYLGQGINDPAILDPTQVATLNNTAVVSVHNADPTALVCTSAYGQLQTERDGGVYAFQGQPYPGQTGSFPPVSGLDYNGAFNAVGLHTYNLGMAYNSNEGTTGHNRNDNPECLLAYNSQPTTPPADLYQNVTRSIIPTYVPGNIVYWDTESGRQLDYDCASNPDYFAAEWVRTTLCEWMAGFQWQGHYVAQNTGGDSTYSLFGTKAETAMKFLTQTTSGRSIVSMNYPSFTGVLPPADNLWSLTLSGSPTVQLVWNPTPSPSSINATVPPGWTATDMYGNSLPITNGTLPMTETSGVYYLTNAVVESSTLQLSPSTLALDNLAANATVTASCTLKNTSASSITLTPDIAARDPSGNNCDFGSNVGTTTLAPGQTVAISATRTFTSSSPTGNYTVFMAYQVNGTYYNLAPILTLTVKPNSVAESSTLKLSPSNLALDNLAANATVTASCTLKNTSATSITLTPDIAAQDPHGNSCDFGSNVGTTTIPPGGTLPITISKTFTSSSLTGSYPVLMAYQVNGTYYNLMPTLTLTVSTNSVVESSTLKLSQSSITLSNASPSATVTASCTLKNTSASSITLTPDVAAQDPNGNSCDFGSNVGTTTIPPGGTLPITISKTFTQASPAGTYHILMAYQVNGTYYNLAPTLTLKVNVSH